MSKFNTTSQTSCADGHETKVGTGRGLQRKFAPVAALAVAAGGLLVAPSASAETTCTVSGQNLTLRQSNGNVIVVNANGSTLGPRGLARATPSSATYGDVSGGIQGRKVNFTISWTSNDGQAQFTGTVGEDGIAHGTSSGPSVPINLWNPAPWSSEAPLTCTDTQAPERPTATATGDVDVYDRPNWPVGAGNRLGILRSGTQVQLVGACKPEDWCQVSGSDVPGGRGFVWGHLNLP